MARDGQVFFIHNRVETIEAIAALSERAFLEAATDSPDGFEMRASLFSMTRTLN